MHRYAIPPKPVMKKPMKTSNADHLFLRPAIELDTDQARETWPELATVAETTETPMDEDATDAPVDVKEEVPTEEPHTTVREIPPVEPVSLHDLPLDFAIVLSILSTSSALVVSQKKYLLASAQEDQDEGDDKTPEENSATTQQDAAATVMSPYDETRIQRLLCSILLVGGGLSHVHGIRNWLAER